MNLRAGDDRRRHNRRGSDVGPAVYHLNRENRRDCRALRAPAAADGKEGVAGIEELLVELPRAAVEAVMRVSQTPDQNKFPLYWTLHGNHYVEPRAKSLYISAI